MGVGRLSGGGNSLSFTTFSLVSSKLTARPPERIAGDRQGILRVHARPLFVTDGSLTAAQLERLGSDGHLLLPGLLTADATAELTEAVSRVGEFGAKWKAKHRPKAELHRLRQMRAAAAADAAAGDAGAAADGEAADVHDGSDEGGAAEKGSGGSDEEEEEEEAAARSAEEEVCGRTPFPSVLLYPVSV